MDRGGPPVQHFGVLVDIGVFITINNDGLLISENAPQYMPSFELNNRVVQRAEACGMEFALSIIRLAGRGHIDAGVARYGVVVRHPGATALI